jgi:acetoacetyl-CoA synthetase
MARFMQRCGERHGVAPGYRSLHQWSTEDLGAFWGELADFTGVQFSQSAETVWSRGEQMQSVRWFEGATLNFAQNLLLERSDVAADSPAIICRDERGRRTELSWQELRAQTARVAAALRLKGIVPGDRIAAVMPNCSETVIILLASASIGAVFSSCSPDFGAQAIVDRFRQIEPRILFACDGYAYGGKSIDCRAKAGSVAEQLAVEHLVIVPFLNEQPDISELTRAELFTALLVESAPENYAALPFNHPLCIMYTSGTTGVPKCIVHGAGGTLLQHRKEHVLHTDLSAGERLFYFTTCGWMMWNWLVSALASGVTLVLYDGSPFYPDGGSLWQLADEEQVSVFGTSPRFLGATAKRFRDVAEQLEFQSLRTILCTGAPLAAESYDFVRETIGERIQLSSISGGTDLISCFVLGNPLLPVYRGEIQSPGLGMAVDVYDDQGNAITGGAGELVCTQPFPSMPLGFWNDADGERYRHAYFERFPNVWAQGDYAEWTAQGGMVIHGRSDGVLNPGGVRIGSAEVCDPALALDEIDDVIAVGQQYANEERIVLCVVLRKDLQMTEALQKTIKSAIRAATSPRHVPAVIVDVQDLPRTISGKTVELAVRAVIHGETVENKGAIANPEALEYFRDRLELA